MLKKCIVIMVMFTLITGAAFAQLTVGGQLQQGFVLLSGNNVEDTDVNFGGEYTGDGPFHEAKISLLFGDGTAGGRLVMPAKGTYWGWMQWRPSQYFRIKIGSDGDGEWGFPQIAGWGFTGEAKNSVAAVSDYNGSLAMSSRNNGLNYGAYDGGAGQFHLGLSFFPLDMLQVHLLFRNIDEGQEISERFAKLQFIASYKIEEIGTIRFAAVGNGGLAKEKDDYVADEHPEGKDIGTLWLAFYSNEIVQGLAFEVGANFNLPHIDADYSVYSNMNIAAGVNLTMFDPFAFKLRTNFSFGGKELVKEKQKFADVDADGDPITVEKTVATGNTDLTTKWGIGILPSYKLAKMTIFLHAGMGLEFNKEREVTQEDGTKVKETFTEYDWFVNPYVWVPMGGMRMWIGVQILDGHASKDGQINWNVPMGFNFYF